MSDTTENPAAGAAPENEPQSPEQIRAEIERTQEELGDTVEALAYKTDVKAQAAERIDAAKESIQGTVHGTRESITDTKDEFVSKVSGHARDGQRRGAADERCRAGQAAAVCHRRGVRSRRAVRLADRSGVGREPGRHLRVSTDGRPTLPTGRPVERDAPDQPSDLPRSAWSGVLKRTIREFNADHLTDLAAALTYYGVLAIFPMLVVIVSLVGLLGHSVTQSLIHNLSSVAPGTTKQILTNAIENIQLTAAPRAWHSSSGWWPRCGRHRDTWRPSCGLPTSSGTLRRDGRSTRRCRSGSASR